MVNHQLARQLRQCGPGQAVFGQQERRCEGVGDIFHIRRDAKVPLFGIGVRKGTQISLELELDIRCNSCPHGVPHVKAHRLIQHQWQVAVHLCALCTAQGSLQVQNAGEAPLLVHHTLCDLRGLPLHLGFALHIGIAETQVGQRNLDAFAFQFPLHIPAQLVQWNHRRFKNARQIHCPTLHGNGGAPSCLGHIEIYRAPLHARCVLRGALRGNFQLDHTALGSKTLGRGHRAQPGGLHLLHQPLGLVGCQRLVYGCVQRQALGNFHHSRQVQPVRTDFPMRRLAGIAAEQAHPHVAAWPVQTILRMESQRFGRELVAIVEPPGTHPARHSGQHQRLQLGRYPDVDLVHGHVRGGMGEFGPVDIHPGAQGASALRDIHTQIQITTQLRHVHMRKVGVRLSLPLAPVTRTAAQQRLAKDP